MSSNAVGDVFQLVGTTLEGRFSVEQVVAEGGFGVVYYAQQAALERPVALKVLKTPGRFNDEAKAQFLAGFATEAKTIARIAHPNIVHVYDFGVSLMPSGTPAAWMALEWLTGVTFEAELLRRRGRGGRSPSECLALLRPVLSALAMVHAGGVAHRDLKPANVMLVESPNGAVLKLLDFGIAKIMHADETPGSGTTQTRSNQIAFSPGYASPEQISNGRSGPWTDVHAMGLILTEVLTDHAALEGEDIPIIFQQVLDRVRPTPAKYGVKVGAWEAVLARALSVSAAERHRDAGELLRALEATVVEASAAYVGRPDPVHEAALIGSSDTLEVMSTVPSYPVGAMTPQRARVTTHTPMSEAEPIMRPARGSRAAVYLTGVALVVAAVAGIGWRVATTAATARPAAAVTGDATIAAPASAAEIPSAPAEPSASATGLPAPPAAPPDAATPSRRSPSRAPSAPRAAPSAPPAKSAAPERLIIE